MRRILLPAPKPNPGSLLAWFVFYVLVAGVIGLLQPSAGQPAWYPPVGIGVFMLLTFGTWAVPAVLVGDLLGAVVQYDLAVGPALVSGSVTALEILLVAVLLQRLGFDRRLSRVEDVAIMAGAGAVGALLAATLGTALIQLIDSDAPTQRAIWFIGDLSGLTITLPLLLMAAGGAVVWRDARRMPVRQAVEMGMVAVLSLALVFGYFVRIDPGDLDVASSGTLLLCLLPVFWFAVRFGTLPTTVFILLVLVTASLGFTGLGPHLPHAGSDVSATSWNQMQVQVSIFAVSLAALGVAVAVSAQREAFGRELALVNASPVGIISLDRHGAVTSWNSAAERIFGFTSDEAIGRLPPMIPPEDLDQFRERLSIEIWEPLERFVSYRRKDGVRITARLYTSPLLDAGGRPAGVMGVIEDVTELVALQERQALLTAAMDQAAESIIVTDLQGTIVYANPSASTVSGYEMEEVLGRNPRIFKSGLHDGSFYDDLWGTITSGGTWQGVMVNQRKSGELYHEQVGIRPVNDADGRPIAYVGVKHDLTQQRKLEESIQRDRRTRAKVMEVMERVRPADTVAATADALAKGIVDVTNFDLAVVLLKHADGALLAVGEAGPPGPTRRGRVLGVDQGAAELIALTGRATWWTSTDPSAERLGPWSDRLDLEPTGAVAFAPLRWGNELFGALMVASHDPSGPEWIEGELPMLAEIASFGAVLLGSQAEKEQWNADVTAEIRDIIAHRRFLPVFQPIVDLTTGEPVGYEALTRFDDGTRPDWRIRDAWSSGTGIELELALASAAIEAAGQVLPPHLHVSLNFSPETILDGSVARLVRDVDRPIVIEVTEHTRIDDYAALRQALDGYGGGVKISVDDAGAGFASLRHILELQPDIVKLDVGLIRGIDTDLARQALAAGLCHYAERTQTRLIAEGVETAEEASMIQSLGVSCAQGYYFGRPSPTG